MQVSLSTDSALLGGYALRDTTRGGGFYTTDMNNLGSVPIVGDTLPLPPLLLPGTTFTDSDNVWGDGTPGNRQSAAVDAHFGQQTTYDYSPAAWPTTSSTCWPRAPTPPVAAAWSAVSVN